MISEMNQPIRAESDLIVPDGKQVFLRDGVTLTENLKKEIMTRLQSSVRVVDVRNDQGNIQIETPDRDAAPHDFEDAQARKAELRETWTGDPNVKRVLQITSSAQADSLNKQLKEKTLCFDQDEL